MWFPFIYHGYACIITIPIDPPSFIERPQNVESEMGDNITMNCLVDSNPKADIIWVFDPIDRVSSTAIFLPVPPHSFVGESLWNRVFQFINNGNVCIFLSPFLSLSFDWQINFQPRVVGTSSTLHLIASNETAGRYYCKAHSSGFQEISSEALVILKGPPKILSNAQQHPLDGGTYEIDCTAIAVPKAKHVSWAFNGVLIDTDKDFGFSLQQDVLYDRIKSTLRIEQNHRKYFGTYSCTVINKYGSDTLDIVFRERSELNIRSMGKQSI